MVPVGIDTVVFDVNGFSKREYLDRAPGVGKACLLPLAAHAHGVSWP